MKVLVTGANGFVGKNLVSTLKTLDGYEIYEYDKGNTIEDLKDYTKKCEFVVNLAGVNRPQNIQEFYDGNAGFTEVLCNLLIESNNKSPILISSSIQAECDNDYGKSKKEGEELLLEYGEKHNVKILVYRFANLFGKWCRPNYNSVVATWCYNIANDEEIKINDKSVELSLCYIDDVIEEITNAINNNATCINGQYRVEPMYYIKLGELCNLLLSFRDSRKSLKIPNMRDELTKKLYSTYLSYLPIEKFSYPLKMNVDKRGSFTEFLKTESYGQVSVNISKPGITKGNHWHHTKTEKFLVVQGNGLIQFRSILGTEIIEYNVCGNNLEVIDIPPGYTHNIINVGDSDMVTVMWANEELDKEYPDTFFQEV